MEDDNGYLYVDWGKGNMFSGYDQHQRPRLPEQYSRKKVINNRMCFLSLAFFFF